MIEEDITRLESRVDDIEKRFTNLVDTLTAGFGGEQAARLHYTEARCASLEEQMASMRSAASDNNQMFIELGRALGIRSGTITRENLLNAVKKLRAAAKETK